MKLKRRLPIAIVFLLAATGLAAFSFLSTGFALQSDKQIATNLVGNGKFVHDYGVVVLPSSLLNAKGLSISQRLTNRDNGKLGCGLSYNQFYNLSQLKDTKVSSFNVKGNTKMLISVDQQASQQAVQAALVPKDGKQNLNCKAVKSGRFFFFDSPIQLSYSQQHENS